MGDTRDRAMAIAMLVEAFNVKPADMTPARVLAYENALRDVPIPLLNAAVRKAIETRTFFPKVAELRNDAETCRRQLMAANQYSPCAQCDESGWEPVEIDGVRRLRRCGCWRRYQARLASLGVTDQPLALPPAREREFIND
jgi:hypothetical protein